VTTLKTLLAQDKWQRSDLLLTCGKTDAIGNLSSVTTRSDELVVMAHPDEEAVAFSHRFAGCKCSIPQFSGEY
jgi:hypothetical protein